MTGIVSQLEVHVPTLSTDQVPAAVPLTGRQLLLSFIDLDTSDVRVRPL